MAFRNSSPPASQSLRAARARLVNVVEVELVSPSEGSYFGRGDFGTPGRLARNSGLVLERVYVLIPLVFIRFCQELSLGIIRIGLLTFICQWCEAFSSFVAPSGAIIEERAGSVGQEF